MNICQEKLYKGIREQNTPEDIKFFVCGGDGSLNEVLNGSFGFPNVAVGVVPVGTGNDFIRNFADKKLFLDLKNQLQGDTRKVDIIKYTYEIVKDEKKYVKTSYCANMFNMGFDCEAADMMQKMKKIPFVSGHFAYVLGVLVVLIKKMGANIYKNKKPLLFFLLPAFAFMAVYLYYPFFQNIINRCYAKFFSTV